MEAQLEQIRGMLGPDGYTLAWRQTGERTVELEVIAGEDACAECLVPKPLMLEIVNGLLGEVGVRVSSLVYPVDGAHR